MNDIINEAKSKGIRVLQFGDVDFERAKKSLQELMGEENMNLIWIANDLSDGSKRCFKFCERVMLSRKMFLQYLLL